jgi:DNA-3-methyladenine glycosylase II
MFLIFNLLRPDVWPLDDIGLLRAVALHWGPNRSLEKVVAANRPLEGGREKASKASREQAREVGEALRPWRSVATWYLWRSLDPVPVAY